MFWSLGCVRDGWATLEETSSHSGAKPNWARPWTSPGWCAFAKHRTNWQRTKWSQLWRPAQVKHSTNWQRTKWSWCTGHSTSLWDFKKLANPVQEAHTRWIEQSDSARPRILEGRCSTWSKLLLLDLWFPFGKTSRWFVALWLFKLDFYKQHVCWKDSIQWDDKLHWVWKTALAKPTVLAMVCY